MPVSKALRSLLKIRHLQEGQEKAALDSALGYLNAVENAIGNSKNREREAREQITQDGSEDAEIAFRSSDLQSSIEHQRQSVLAVQQSQTQERVDLARADYLSRRMERRQAEIVVEGAQKREEAVAGRRLQRSIDDWFNARERKDDET